MKKYQAAIFDMDGTMVDNMMVHHRAWQASLKALGTDWPIEKVMQEVHGVNEEILHRLYGDRFTRTERLSISDKKEKAYREIFLPELKLIDGLTPFLDTLQAAEVPLAIGTAAPPENANFLLDNLPIRKYFKAIFHAGDVKKGKPDPEVFLLGTNALKILPKDCIVFEDSITGAAAAKNAGCAAIIVTTTHQKEEFAAFDHILEFIKDFSDVDKLMRYFG